jgi:hypothetical protein
MVTRGGFIFKDGEKGCLVFEEDYNGSLHQIGDLFNIFADDVEMMTEREFSDCLKYNDIIGDV